MTRKEQREDAIKEMVKKLIQKLKIAEKQLLNPEDTAVGEYLKQADAREFVVSFFSYFDPKKDNVCDDAISDLEIMEGE